jgi:Rrf2 family nitric oxide-sensitive transcriptional repressor
LQTLTTPRKVDIMQLSKFTDYALRTLMHLAVAEDHMLTTRQIAEIHGAKYNHLAKVTQWLVREGLVVSLRGRSGGLRLGKPTSGINIGHVVRNLEGQSDLVECLQADGGQCLLSPSCGLTFALKAAQDAFFASLETLTLADLTDKNRHMAQLLTQLNAPENRA